MNEKLKRHNLIDFFFGYFLSFYDKTKAIIEKVCWK